MSVLEPRHVAVVGNIGSGKTTVVELLTEQLPQRLGDVHAIGVHENFRHNPFLAWFYRDKGRWAFHSQVFFLLEKLREVTAIAHVTGRVPTDRMQQRFALTWLLGSEEAAEQILALDLPLVVFQDASLEQYRRMYVAALAVEMGEESFHLYMELFGTLAAFVPGGLHPDMTICLTASVSVLLERIRERAARENRPYEKDMDPAYLEALEHHLEDWLRGAAWPKVLRLDTSPLILTGDGVREQDRDFVVREVIATLERL